MSFDKEIPAFAEKYFLALQSAQDETPENGLCGFEMEWNLLDDSFRPLLTVGSEPHTQSFVDYLRQRFIPEALHPFCQREVFHWMIEWATRPYYRPRHAVYATRLLESLLLNALHLAGESFGKRLYAWHGNLLYPTRVGRKSIPQSWSIAKRRYLERCVEMYGDSLATAGTHTNLSLPEPLLAWDYMHRTPAERRRQRLEDYKSEVYVTATRIIRAFAALFIATTASTPWQAQIRNGQPAVVLTDFDSVRNLTFPNPPTLDVPDLYRSHRDYLHIATELVRQGVRFGNNNWTPVRARSFAERVEQVIAVTSDQLQALYAKRLYALGEHTADPVEAMAHQIEVENLITRLRIPMARVEVRTDDGGNPLALDIANLTLKHLLLLRLYADPSFGRAFRYDQEDITRARHNEDLAARHGLRAVIEDPFTGKPISMRDFLRRTLADLRPLAEALHLWEDLHPLVEMAAGAPNTAERLRAHLQEQTREGIIPLQALQQLAEARQSQVQQEVYTILKDLHESGHPAHKLEELLSLGRAQSRRAAEPAVRLTLPPQVRIPPQDTTAEVLDIAQALIRIPSVTACPQERIEEVYRAGNWISDYLRTHGLHVHTFNQSRYPAVLATFPGGENAPVWLVGHYDVVAPEPDDRQFEPRIEGEYLWGRGAADMKTVVATCLVWMKDALRRGAPYPPFALLLVGNEENGETEPMGTPHVLRAWTEGGNPPPALMVAGERTGESGADLWGEICIQNRGVARLEIVAHGKRGHSGVAGAHADLTARLAAAQQTLYTLAADHLTLHSEDGWQSQVRFPYIRVGEPGLFNITAERGVLGVEIRSIPQDDLHGLLDAIRAWCNQQDMDVAVSAQENGVACAPENPHLQALLRAVERVSGQPPRIGRKLPGTSARFAPGGQGIVWGQSGIGPHSSQERHYIPSILPYYRALNAWAFGDA